MRKMASRTAAITLLTLLTLTGCSSGSDSDGGKSGDKQTSAPEVEAADGLTVEGTGYTYVVPDGWKTPDEDIAGTEQTDTFAADFDDKDGFADNINVIRLDPAPVEDLDDLEKALIAELEGSSAKNVTARDRLEIDGTAAVHIASLNTLQGKDYLTEQYNAIRDGVSYVITFSYSPDVSENDRDEVAQSVLSTWKWSA